MITTISIYVLVAFLAALAGVAGLLVASRGVKWVGSRGVLRFYLWMIMFGPTVRLMTAPREYLTQADVTMAGYTAMAGWVSWVLRLSSLAIVGVAAVTVLLAIVKKQRPEGGALFVAGLAAVALSLLTSATLGEKPAFIHQSIYTVLLMASLMLMPRLAPEVVAIEVKRVLAVLMVGSLVLAALQPSQYVETTHLGLIPGFSIRLHGLAPHANSLAPLALLYLVLAHWVPGRQPWHFLGMATALLVLVLTQSKTIWATGLLIVALFAAMRLGRAFGDELRTARPGPAGVAAMLAYFGVVLLIALLITTGKMVALIDVISADRGLTTLTGRTDIWQITINTWLNNVWFGYGPKLWDLEFRLAHGAALAAWHAHNQYIHTLGEAGIIGLAAMLLYTAAFVYYGSKFARCTGGATLALLLLILVRTITEIPLRFSVLLDTTFFVHVVVFAILLMLARQSAAETSGAGAPVARGRLACAA